MLTIVSALKSEITPLLNHFKITAKYKVGSGSLYIAGQFHFLRIGIGGKTGLSNFKLYLNDFTPVKILNIGLAGSMNAAIKPGQLFAIRSVRRRLATSQIKLNPTIQSDLTETTLLTVDQALIDAKQRDILFSEYQTDLVDMEAWYLAQYSAQKQIPLSSIKIVSDQADQFTKEAFMANYQKLSRQLAETILPLIQHRMATN